MSSKLENNLRAEFLDAIRICKIKHGYNPTRILQMLERYGPVDAATNLVLDSKLHDGFRKMYELGLLHLTIEAIICQDPYYQLFPGNVIDAAKSRLEQLGYKAKK